MKKFTIFYKDTSCGWGGQIFNVEAENENEAILKWKSDPNYHDYYELEKIEENA